MFGFLKKEKELEIYSPVKGTMIPLETVNDQVFATKMMGDGVAFVLSDDVISAPCDGSITLIPETFHAIGFTTDLGAEILIHVGLDTVNLAGEGFEQLATVGTKVKKGTPVLKVDRTALENKGIDLTTPMIITNSNQVKIEKETVENVDNSTIVMHCKK